MNGYKLTLEPVDDNRAVWLITESMVGVRQQEIVRLREGFGFLDVREAILATGWVNQDGAELRFTIASRGLTGKVMAGMIEEIFGYFNAPGHPTKQLLEVQSAVGEYESMRESRLDIPLYAYAWLDLVVREDIADEARGIKSIWNASRAVIETDRCCDRRVAELVSRYAHPPARAASRLSGSISTRNPNTSRDTKTG